MCNVPLKYGFVIKNDIFLTYSEIVMSRDSNSRPEIMTSEMNSLYINQVWTMVKVSMGMTQQVAIRDVNLDFCYCHTLSREFVSSERANSFIDYDRS